MEPATTSDGRAPAPLGARSLRSRAVTLALLAIGVLTLLLAVPGLRAVLHELRHASPGWVAVAIGLELASCFSYVVIFRHFFDRLPARLSRRVAWTEMGSGALLPGGGAGSLAIGGWLLHLAGMSTRQIVCRSSGLFFLTSATNVAALVAGGVLLLAGNGSFAHPLLLGGIPVLAGVVALAAALLLPRLRRAHPHWSTGRPWLGELVAGVGAAERALLRPTWRELGAIGYLGFDVAVLWVTLKAIGYSPPLATLVLGYIIGYLANLVPIPGGIGVLEGGLAGTLILYGAPAPEALAGVLIYHAIAFWIPSLGGLGAYGLLRRLQRDAIEAMEPAPRRSPAGRVRARARLAAPPAAHPGTPAARR